MSDLKDRQFHFLADVRTEVGKARAKFPETRHNLAALMEEAGELAQALLDHWKGDGATPADIYKEAVQTAGMAMRIATEGDSVFAARPSSNEVDYSEELANDQFSFLANVRIEQYVHGANQLPALAMLQTHCGKLAESQLSLDSGPFFDPAAWSEAVSVAYLAMRIATEGDSGFPYDPAEVA